MECGRTQAEQEGKLTEAETASFLTPCEVWGRAARNAESKVILYADTMTKSMDAAIKETERRRKLQIEYNHQHKIKPKTIIKAIPEKKTEITDTKHIPKEDVPRMIKELQKKMKEASENLEFEQAIKIRDKINELKGRISFKRCCLTWIFTPHHPITPLLRHYVQIESWNNGKME